MRGCSSSGNTLTEEWILHRVSLVEDGETVSLVNPRAGGTQTNLVNYTGVYQHPGASKLLGPESALLNPHIPNQLSIHGLRQNLPPPQHPEDPG